MKTLRHILISGLFVVMLVWFSCARPRFQFPLQQMQSPPAGLSSDQVPQFVSIGNDDVGYSGLEASGGAGGIHYLTQLLAERKNPPGSNRATFDGQSPHYSFYVNTIYITPQGKEDPALVKAAWKEAVDHGHEIGVHTHSHPHGRNFSVEQWQDEMQKCISFLTSPEGLGLRRGQLIGFRTPFIEYHNNTLTSVRLTGLKYDCSIEEGFQTDADGRNFIWPFRLDRGSPGNSATYEQLDLPLVKKHPGLWEIPPYAYIVPPDDLCEKYGVPPGLRSRLKETNNYFEVDQGKITGFDWNLWFEFGMSKAEFVATLKHTLDLRLQGNRCPLTVGLHSDIYADRNPEKPPQTTPAERREALREFVDYALSKPEVRFVSARELLNWLEAPVPLQVASVAKQKGAPHVVRVSYMENAAPAKKQLGAGFRYLVFNPEIDPDPEYWARVGREMAARFPGSVPEAIWIVSRVKVRSADKGSQLSFPVAKLHSKMISDSPRDLNEAALKKFDELGFRVWLQIEPGFAPVEELLHLVMERYAGHPSVVGAGIDVEWYRSTNPDAGEAVSDKLARAWLAAIRSHNPNYQLFLKHWLIERMPPTVREGLLFVDDSQVFPTMDPMIEEFAQWAKAFAPAPVAFQYGYPSDQPWWSKLKDPPKEIGERILQVAPNTTGLYWVDYSALTVFPKN